MISRLPALRRYFSTINAKRLVVFLVLLLLAAYIQVLLSIAYYPALLSQKFAEPGKIKADAAIVLGASVWKDKPSPVFAERIKHGIQLYKNGQVPYLIFTGGLSAGDSLSESAAARQYAMAEGVPAAQILIEETSTNTWQNLAQSCRLMQEHKLHKVLIVSDPLHMKRAMSMADDLRIHAISAATPTSRYVSWRSKSQALLYESFFYVKYKLLDAHEHDCK
ncbi:MAG: YdcF family protein [Undibacterium umbellatum]|uniref:YdcF family protein n=1 Tax=Undibacterium umbellatum TaxID=2762300 RepID=UPI003BB78F5F